MITRCFNVHSKAKNWDFFLVGNMAKQKIGEEIKHRTPVAF